MKPLSPFDLLNMFEEMTPGERKVYHVGSIRYDRGSDRKSQVNLDLWKLATITRILEREQLAILCMKRVDAFVYEHYIQKRSGVDYIPEWISDEAEKLEHRTTIGGLI